MVERTHDYLLVRRAYEQGRLRTSTARAAFVAAPIAAVAWALSGRQSLPWLLLTLGAWTLAYWRGGAVLRGAFYGLMGGVVTFLLPMSVLRPCCVPGMPQGPDCCTMPGMCLGAGAVVGMLLAMLVPFGKASWWRTAAGMSLGIASVAVLKCATLFVGEAVGLVAGLLAGVLAASAARELLRRRAVA